jgi:hypothetical protein
VDDDTTSTEKRPSGGPSEPPEPPGPAEGERPFPPGKPTEPIRPQHGGTDPIPERVRQPIVVPHKVSTIAGLPRGLAIAAVLLLALAFVAGFFIGRALEGDEASEATPAAIGRRGACGKALTLSLQLGELQQQALANRTQAAQAIAVGDEAQVQELNAALEPLAPALQQTQTELDAAVDKCRSGGGGKGKGKGKGGKGGQGQGGG